MLSGGDVFMKKKLLGSVMLLSATLIWGTAFVAQSAGMALVGPFTFQLGRNVLAAGFLALWVLCADPARFAGQWKNPRLWKSGILCGCALFLASSLQQIGLTETGAGKAGFLTSLYILLVPLLELFFRKRPSRRTVLSLIPAVIGLYLLCGAGGRLRLGDLLLLLCALAFAVQIIAVERLGGGLNGIALNCIQSLTCAVLALPFVLLKEKPAWQDVTACWLPLCYAGLLSSGVGYTLQIFGQQRLDAAPAALIMSLESVFAALAGWIIQHDVLTAPEAVGCALVFSAVIFAQLPAGFRKKSGKGTGLPH